MPLGRSATLMSHSLYISTRKRRGCGLLMHDIVQYVKLKDQSHFLKTGREDTQYVKLKDQSHFLKTGSIHTREFSINRGTVTTYNNPHLFFLFQYSSDTLSKLDIQPCIWSRCQQSSNIWSNLHHNCQ